MQGLNFYLQLITFVKDRTMHLNLVFSDYHSLLVSISMSNKQDYISQKLSKMCICYRQLLKPDLILEDQSQFTDNANIN